MPCAAARSKQGAGAQVRATDEVRRVSFSNATSKSAPSPATRVRHPQDLKAFAWSLYKGVPPANLKSTWCGPQLNRIVKSMDGVECIRLQRIALVICPSTGCTLLSDRNPQFKCLAICMRFNLFPFDGWPAHRPEESVLRNERLGTACFHSPPTRLARIRHGTQCLNAAFRFAVAAPARAFSPSK